MINLKETCKKVKTPFIKDISFVGLCHAISVVASIGRQIILAKFLEVKIFGMFALAQTYINLVEMTVVVRGGEVALYWIGRSWKERNISIVRGYAKFLSHREFVWNVLTYLAVLLSTFLLKKTGKFDLCLVSILGLSIPAQSGYGVAKSIFVASDRIKLLAFFEMAYTIVLLMLVMLLVLQYNVYGAAWAFVIAAILKTSIATFITNRLWPKKDYKVSLIRPPHERLSEYSLLRNVLKNLAMQGDVLILGIMALPEVLAIYKVARTLANLPIRVAGPVWSVLRPKLLSAIREKNYNRFRRLLIIPGFGFVFIGLFLVIPLAWIGGKAFICWAYGEQYKSAGDLFPILLIGTWVFGAVTGWLNFVLILSANKKLGVLIMLTLTSSILLLSYLANGNAAITAWGVTFSFVFVSILAWILAIKTSKLIK